jgi:hypothetical protein
MHIPRRGEIAAYVAKHFDVPFGIEQRQIGRLKEGTVRAEAANELAKLLVQRINRLILPDDPSSPGDDVERRLSELPYRMFFNEASDGEPLEFLVRDGAKFFAHHSELAARSEETPRGHGTTPSLDLDIYLYFFAIPILANNLFKYSRGGKLLKLSEVGTNSGLWFLPSAAKGEESGITPLANALTWLRWRLGGEQDALRAFLCPKVDADSAAKEIQRWRDGDVIPSSARIEEWANRFEGNRKHLRVILHLGAAMTRIWRHMVSTLGIDRAVALNSHLATLLTVLHEAGDRAVGGRPNFEGQSSEAMRCLRWIYSGPQIGTISLGPNYGELVAEMQAAFVSGHSPLVAGA